MSRGTFKVLMAWVLGELYVSEEAQEEMTQGQVDAFTSAAVRRRRAFGLVVKRNWHLEAAVRDLDLPPELRELWTIPEGFAVDRLIGYQDGDRFVPGIAGLEPQESRCLRWRVLMFESTENIMRWTGCKPHTIADHVWTAKRKLRRLFGLAEPSRTRAG